jgi:hypothetical protein
VARVYGVGLDPLTVEFRRRLPDLAAIVERHKRPAGVRSFEIEQSLDDPWHQPFWGESTWQSPRSGSWSLSTIVTVEFTDGARFTYALELGVVTDADPETLAGSK